MHTGILIIGQGISGTFLSFELEKHGIPFIVIDDGNPFSSSRVAAGIINPVTGRRMVKTWMIDTLLETVRQSYSEIESYLNIAVLREIAVLDFFPTPQMRNAFIVRHNETAEFLKLPADPHEYLSTFRYDFGFGKITPCYIADIFLLLQEWRNSLQLNQRLLNETFDPEFLSIETDRISYKDITASHIIFCDGSGSFENKYFKNLPFAPNKGEALIIETDLPEDFIYKKGTSIVPLKNGLFWVGSSYEWSFDDASPTKDFRARMEGFLRSFLKIPYSILDHKASVRPATIERRPFIGFHPQYKNIGIMNGMGTKGCSLAPYFAKELANNLTNGKTLLPEADIKRFTGILTK